MTLYMGLSHFFNGLIVFHRTSLVAQMVKRLPTMQETRFYPWVGKVLWRRKWQPTPVLLPGKSHGWRRVVGYSPWVAKSWRRLSDFTSSLHNIPLSKFCTVCFVLYSIGGFLSCFQLFSVENSEAGNILLHIFAHLSNISVQQIPRSRITAPKGIFYTIDRY